MHWFKRLWRARDGSIIVLGALSLVSVMGMTGLAVEAGNGYVAKVRNQRVADVAALGAALAYKSSSSISIAQQTASDIVVANGLPSTAATASQVTVGTTSAIQVTVSTEVPIKLAQVLTSAASYTVKNVATASLAGGGGAGCITALGNSDTSISADGGASISASGCGITTNGKVYSSNGSAKVTAKQITAVAINQSGGGVTTAPTGSNWTLKSNGASDFVKTGIPAVQTALCLVNKLNNTSDPDYPGGNTSCSSPVVTVSAKSTSSTTDWTTDWSARTTSGFDQYTNGNCNYTIPKGTYDIRKLTVGGGCSISFADGSTLTFGSIDMSGASMSIGDGSLTVTGNFNVSANNAITIGDGAHYFGSLTIGGGKKLDVGSGDFTLYGGISVSGGAYLKVDIAAGNAVTIGANGASSAINIGGGSQVCFTKDCTAPTVTAGTFSANGDVIVAGGGSDMVFPQAAMHVINGDFTATAGVIFGAGEYVVGGDFTNATGSGSDSMNGTNVTFVLGGIFNFGGGAYYDLGAPTSASGFGIPDVLLVTKSSSATTISAGANGKIGGLVYAPNSALSSTGGSSITSKGSQCMMLMVKSVQVTGSGTVSTANCSTIVAAAGSSGSVALIQ